MFGGLEKIIADKVAEIDAKRTAEHRAVIGLLTEIRDLLAAAADQAEYASHRAGCKCGYCGKG